MCRSFEIHINKRKNEEDVETRPKRSRCDEDDVNVDDIKYVQFFLLHQIMCVINFWCCSFEELKNRIVVHTIDTLETCTHEVACPPGQEYIALQPHSAEPAKKYSFVLDPFQKESILCVDNNQSVLVSAHTSAGKTVVAE